MSYLSVGRPEMPSCFVSSWTPLLYPASASALMSLFRPEELPLHRVKSWYTHIPYATAWIRQCSTRRISVFGRANRMALLTELQKELEPLRADHEELCVEGVRAE